MSVLDSGRSGILQLAGTTVADMLLRRWRSTPELLCMPGPVSRRATDARLVRAARASDDRAVVTLDTSAGRAEDSGAPAAALDERLTDAVSDGLGGLLDWFALRLDGLGPRVVDGGDVLAVGLEFDAVPGDDRAWDGFDRNLLGRTDWSLTLDGDLLAERMQDRFAARAAQLGAVLHPGSPRVEWGERTFVFATGDFTVPGYGSQGFELVVWYRFVLSGSVLRARRSALTSGEASVERPGWSSNYYVETYGRELADSAFALATDPDAIFPPVRLGFDVAGGRLAASTATHSRRTLRVGGTAHVPEVVIEPRIIVQRHTRRFYEEAASQCVPSRAPAFSLQRVELRAGPGGVRLCGVRVEGDRGFRIATVDLDVLHPAADGRSLVDTPVELAPDSTTTLILSYTGDRVLPAQGSLQIVSTDPQGLLRTVPLELLAGGEPAVELNPPTLAIVVGNSTDGRRTTLGSDCFPIETTPRTPDPNAPDGQFVVENTGEQPIAVCQVRADHDPDDPASRYAFDASLRGPAVVLPGDSGIVEIRFYPPRPRPSDPRDLSGRRRGTGHVYRATVVVELGGGLLGQTRTAQVTGVVEPRPVAREVARRDGTRMRAGFDPRHDAICMRRPDLDLCDLEPFFEPVGPPDARVVADLRLRGVADGSRVTLADRDGIVHVRDLGEGTERRVDVGLGRDRRVGPCIPRIEGGPARGGSVRVELRHAVVTPGPVAVVPDARCVLEHAGYLWVGTGTGLAVLDTRTSATSPPVALRVGPVVGLAVAGGWVWAATDEQVVAVDAARPGAPAVVASIDLDDRVTAVATAAGVLYVAAGAGLRTVTAGPKPTASGRIQHLPEPARWLFAVGGGIVAVGRKSAVTFAAGSAPAPVHTPAFAVTSAGAVGSRVLLHGGQGGQSAGSVALATDGARLRPVAEYPLGHWRAAFAHEPGGRLYVLAGDRVTRWQLAARRLDAAALPEAFEPRYLPVRPD